MENDELGINSMNINATILLQMLHFVLGYAILKILVFKPAHAIIIQKNLHLKIEQKNIEHILFSIESMKKARMHAWRMHNDFFKSHKPALTSPIVTINTTTVDHINDTPSNEEINNLSQDIAVILTQRIISDYR